MSCQHLALVENCGLEKYKLWTMLVWVRISRKCMAPIRTLLAHKIWCMENRRSEHEKWGKKSEKLKMVVVWTATLCMVVWLVSFVFVLPLPSGEMSNTLTAIHIAIRNTFSTISAWIRITRLNFIISRCQLIFIVEIWQQQQQRRR